MKRIVERSTFMLIGALIASIAYFIGNADRGVEAQDGITRFDKIECNELIVSGRSQDGTLGMTLITAVDGKPRLLMSLIKEDRTESILLQVADNFASIGINHMLSRFDATPGILMKTAPDTSSIQVEDKVVFSKTR